MTIFDSVLVTTGILLLFIGIAAVGVFVDHRQWKREIEELKKKAGGPR